MGIYWQRGAGSDAGAKAVRGVIDLFGADRVRARASAFEMRLRTGEIDLVLEA